MVVSISRKHFFAIVFFLLCYCNTVFSQDILPAGSHPPALAFKHFPGKLYAVIWRNWNLVPVERIALTVGATPKQIYTIAEAMGLPAAKTLSEDVHNHIYITVIRRNWHLLPYNQLLTLLHFTEKELEFALKEDDFLFIKLGSLKPECEQVIYKSPDGYTKKQLAIIKKMANNYFQHQAMQPAELPFAFVNALKKLPENVQPVKTAPGELRYIYSYFGIFGDPLIDTIHNPYPEGLLARLAEKGVTGVWMHVVRNLVKTTKKELRILIALHKQQKNMVSRYTCI